MESMKADIDDFSILTIFRRPTSMLNRSRFTKINEKYFGDFLSIISLRMRLAILWVNYIQL
jgi:hypothetical protein